MLNEPNCVGSSVGPINYKFDGVAGAPPGSYVVRTTDTPVILHAVGSPLFGEGRGVQLFDQLAGGDGGFNFNQIRIGDELANHRFATGSVRYDARPLALAINDGCIVTDSAGVISTTNNGGSLLDRTAFFSARHGGLDLAAIINDTRVRSRDLPRRKADIQKLNLDRNGDTYLLSSSMTPDIDLISEYGPFTGFGTSTLDACVEVFRRNGNDQSIMAGLLRRSRGLFQHQQGGAVPLLTLGVPWTSGPSAYVGARITSLDVSAAAAGRSVVNCRPSGCGSVPGPDRHRLQLARHGREQRVPLPAADGEYLTPTFSIFSKGHRRLAVSTIRLCQVPRPT